MAYRPPSLDEKGLHTPQYTEIQEHLMEEYRRIFGTDEGGESLYLGPDTQDYQMISLIAMAYDDAMSALVAAYTSRNPDYATGASLDMLLPINGLRRQSATYATATLTLTGQPGASMPANLQAGDGKGHLWRIPAAFTFDESGIAEKKAQCVTLGAVQADAGTITQIRTPTAGWYSVTNGAAAIPGQDVESDADAKARRADSVALPSRSILEGIKAGLLNIEGVDRIALYENKESAADSNGIPGHSICAVVEGGQEGDIGSAIMLKKAPGSGTYGNVTVAVADSYGESRSLSFFRPVAADIYVNITLKKLQGWDGSMAAAIKEAVAAYAHDVAIGSDYVVSYLWSLVFAAVHSTSPAFSVTAITARKGSGGAAQTGSIPLLFNEGAYCNAAHVTVTVTE